MYYFCIRVDSYKTYHESKIPLFARLIRIIRYNTTKKGKPLKFPFRDPAGIRTQDPNIKSVVLYRLSY